MLFKYTAISASGKKITSTLTAEDKSSALKAIKEKKYQLVDLHEVSSKTVIKKVSSENLLIFTRSLSQLLSAKLPIIESFQTLKQDIKDKNLTYIISDVIDSLKKGEKLSSVLKRYDNVFSPVYISLVESGEASGKLDVVFRKNYEFMEFYYKYARQIQSIIIYPAIVLIFSLVLILGVMIFLIPQFAELYKNLNAQLPLITRIMISISSFFTRNLVLLIIGTVLISGVIYWDIVFNHDSFLKKFRSKIPIFGSILNQMNRIYLSYALGSLLEYKVNLINSLIIVRDSFENDVGLYSKLNLIIEKVKKGKKIGASFREEKIFDDLMNQLITGGEESGKLADMFHSISTFLQEKLDVRMKTLLALLQPILILALGLIIGVIIVSFFLPIFRIIDLI